jgi:hypothetical protein
MIKEKQLIKVVGTIVTGVDGGRPESKTCRGIMLLKRGQAAEEFIAEFLSARGIVQCSLHQRGDNSWAMAPAMFLTQKPNFILTFVFTQFPLSEIGFYGKDLSKAELLRDFKFLKKVIK